MSSIPRWLWLLRLDLALELAGELRRSGVDPLRVVADDIVAVGARGSSSRHTSIGPRHRCPSQLTAQPVGCDPLDAGGVVDRQQLAGCEEIAWHDHLADPQDAVGLEAQPVDPVPEI